jgi:hypothetical protein
VGASEGVGGGSTLAAQASAVSSSLGVVASKVGSEGLSALGGLGGSLLSTLGKQVQQVRQVAEQVKSDFAGVAHANADTASSPSRGAPPSTQPPPGWSEAPRGPAEPIGRP